MYGIPAFANGGVVQKFAEGGLFPKTPGKKYYNKETRQWEEYQPEAETAIPTIEERPTEAATGMTIPSSAYEGSSSTEAELPEDFKMKDKPSKEVIDAVRERIEGGGDTEEDKLKKRFLEKSKLYKEILGSNEKLMKEQGFLQLAQFGLNLASAQGSNFMDKVAKSAKDPLNAFAELGRKAYEDERAVNLLALESTEGEIKAEQQAQVDKELAAIKAMGDAKDTDLSVFQDVFGAEDGKLQYLNFLQGRYGETREDQILTLTNTLIGTPQFLDDQQGAATKATEIVDNVYGNQSQPSPGEPVLVTSQEEYDALEPGTPYKDTEGNQGIKGA